MWQPLLHHLACHLNALQLSFSIAPIFISSYDSMASMAEAACLGPPSRFGLTLVYDPEEAISAERMLGALGLIHISRDPDKVMWPIRLRKDSDIDPAIDEIYGLKMDWQEVFVEDSFYQFLIPELLFEQVHQHCGRMFPDNMVVFKGPGHVAKVDISVVPMDVPPLLQALWAQGTKSLSCADPTTG